MTRIVVLEKVGETALTQRYRKYPLPEGIELRPFYMIDGECWLRVAVLTSEDVPLNTEPLTTESR